MRLAVALIVLFSLLAATAEARTRHARPSGACGGDAAERAAALANAGSLDSLRINLFGRDETGWAVYGPAAAREIGTPCAPDQPGFARALAHWQADHALPSNGIADAVTLKLMKSDWQQHRPFYALRDQGVCPQSPAGDRLATAKDSEVLEGTRTVRLQRGALRAWRRMAAAARRDHAIIGEPDALKLFSGYRSPEDDAARCASENNCQGLVRAACSAHRTGLALDLNLGSAAGYSVDSTADANRLYQSKTRAYRWLVRNAGRYGFVNYVFEPWHWEWTGRRP